jgi:hypothetical protein
MSFLHDLFSKKQPATPSNSQPSRVVKRSKSKHDYSIRCWINDNNMFPLAATLDLNEEDLAFTMDYGYGRDAGDPMSRVLQKGLFTPLCKPNQYDVAIFQYSDVESIKLNEGWSSGPRIELICFNRARGQKIKIEMVIDRAEATNDVNETREVYNMLIAETKQSPISKSQPEKSVASITTCPNCNTRVIPKSDGTCPNCQSRISP